MWFSLWNLIGLEREAGRWTAYSTLVNFIHKWLLLLLHPTSGGWKSLWLSVWSQNTAFIQAGVCQCAPWLVFHRGNECPGFGACSEISFSLLQCAIVMDCKSCSAVLENHDLEDIPGLQITFFFPSLQTVILKKVTRTNWNNRQSGHVLFCAKVHHAAGPVMS